MRAVSTTSLSWSTLSLDRSRKALRAELGLTMAIATSSRQKAKCLGLTATAPSRESISLMLKRAAQAVDDLRADIKVVAKALLERETLTGREIRTVIRNAQRKRGRGA